jgi:WD40 repeat protein
LIRPGNDESNEPLFSKTRDLLNPNQPPSLAPENGLVAAVRVASNQVGRILFAPDGKTIAVLTNDGSYLLELASARARTTDQPLAWSPDSKSLAVLGGHQSGFQLALADPSTGQSKMVITDLGLDLCPAAQFSPDGRFFAAVIAEAHHQGNVEKPKPLRKLLMWKCNAWKDEPKTMFVSDESEITSPVFAPDSASVAFVSGTMQDGVGVQIIEVESGKTKAWLTGNHVPDMRSIAYSLDGKSLASTSSDATVTIWDVDARQERVTLRGHQADIAKVTFSPDGTRVATRSFDRSFRLWDANTGKELAARDKEDGNTPEALAFAPDGRLLVTGSGGLLKAWDVAKLMGK